MQFEDSLKASMLLEAGAHAQDAHMYHTKRRCTDERSCLHDNAVLLCVGLLLQGGRACAQRVPDLKVFATGCPLCTCSFAIECHTLTLHEHSSSKLYDAHFGGHALHDAQFSCHSQRQGALAWTQMRNQARHLCEPFSHSVKLDRSMHSPAPCMA